MSPESMPDNRQSPGPFASFGRVIRGYASLWAVFVASLPAPVSWLHAIPIYQAQRGYFGLYSGVLCFLILGYVLYTRDRLVKHTNFPKTNVWTLLLPLLLIACSIACVILYHTTLTTSVEQVIDAGRREGSIVPSDTRTVLATTDEQRIPQSLLLFGLYMGMFVFAEGAFIIFAIKEYIQQALGISEEDLLSNTPKDVVPPSSLEGR